MPNAYLKTQHHQNRNSVSSFPTDISRVFLFFFGQTELKNQKPNKSSVSQWSPTDGECVSSSGDHKWPTLIWCLHSLPLQGEDVSNCPWPSDSHLGHFLFPFFILRRFSLHSHPALTMTTSGSATNAARTRRVGQHSAHSVGNVTEIWTELSHT